MTFPGRTSTGNDYRYGFQGQEKDDELKGPGNSLNYTFRMHDPRVGRFFAVDPLTPQYPHNSPYAFSENRVIDGVELEGLETIQIWINNIYYAFKYGIPKKKSTAVSGMRKVIEGSGYKMGVPNISEGNIQNRRTAEQEKMLMVLDGISDLAEFAIIQPLEAGMEMIGSVPGVDTAADPILASYYSYKYTLTGKQDDAISASSYSVASVIPFASGVVIKYGAKGISKSVRLWIPKTTASGDKFVANLANIIEFSHPNKIKAIDADITNLSLRSRTDIDINIDNAIWIEVKKGSKISEWQVKKQLKASEEEGMEYIYYTGDKLSKQQIKNLTDWGVKKENIINNTKDLMDKIK